MKIIEAVIGFILKLVAGSFLWMIIALIGAFPLGLLLLKLFETFLTDENAFLSEINYELSLLYILFVFTCFAGIILARVVAVSIKVLVDKKLTEKNDKS